LIDIRQGRAGQGLTLPLGGLALQDLSGATPKKAQKIAREKLQAAGLLEVLPGRSFYAVGGTWRALARLQMIERGYPLHVMHGYELAQEEGGFMGLVDRAGSSKAVNAVTEARRPLLAYGATVLDEIVRIGQPATITVSAHGVREGLLYDSLDPQTRAVDPLIEAAAELNRLRARSPGHAEELCAWTDAFMASAGLNESASERRLRHAACLLSDTGWRAHPDYRGSQSVTLITHAAFLGIDHPGRAYVALAVFFRHSGLSLDKVDEGVAGIAGPRLVSLARLFGALLRVAFPITAAMSGVIGRTPLRVAGSGLVLLLPPDLAPLASERLLKRVNSLAKILDLEAAIEIG
jgi:exopolyphosphatase/guanosine-5'-triphosphate,3'-diphosphate pyrophosphatase